MIAPQDVADALNNAGFDTPEKLATLFGWTALTQQRETLKSEIEKVRSDQSAYNQDAEAQVQSRQAQIDAIDKQLRG